MLQAFKFQYQNEIEIRKMKFKNRESHTYHWKLTSIWFMFLLSWSVCSGQEENNKIPELNGHSFVPSTYIEGPFMNTRFALGVGLGSTGEYKYPLFEVDENQIYGVKGQLLFLTVTLDYQQKIQDWVAMFIKFRVAARIGTNVGSILAEGFSSISSFNIGWKINLLEREKTKLSTLIGISNYNGTFLSVSKFVEDIIDNQPYPSLITNTPALNGNLGFQFAYGISELFGFQVNYLNSIGESLQRGETAYYFSFGTGFDLNLYQKHNVPLGFSLGYLLSSRPEQVYRESGNSNSIHFKFAYTGTNDFVLGLQTSYITIPVSEDLENFSTIGVSFALTYYFN